MPGYGETLLTHPKAKSCAAFMASEKLFENRLKAWLMTQGIYPAGTPKQNIQTPPCGWFLKVWGGGYQQSGIPDLLLCVQGFFLAVEVKGVGGKATPLQRLNLGQIKAAGGIGLILYPDGIDNFKNIVKGVMECKSAIAELSALIAANTNTNCVMCIS